MSTKYEGEDFARGGVMIKMLHKKCYLGVSRTFRIFLATLRLKNGQIFLIIITTIIIIIIVIIINCNWVVTQWQWLFYMYTKYEIGY